MKLSDWLSRERVTRTAFARRIGVRPSHITGLCNGSSLPSLSLAWQIEKETDGAVTPSDWQQVTESGEAA